MMTRVFERLFLGDACDAERLAISNPHGIAFVLNVNSGRNREKPDAGVEYIPLSFDEAERVPPAKFEQALAAISEHIRRGKVLVHCEIGSSRSPVVVALYMDAVGYKNFDDAPGENTALKLPLSARRRKEKTARDTFPLSWTEIRCRCFLG